MKRFFLFASAVGLTLAVAAGPALAQHGHGGHGGGHGGFGHGSFGHGGHYGSFGHGGHYSLFGHHLGLSLGLGHHHYYSGYGYPYGYGYAYPTYYGESYYSPTRYLVYGAADPLCSSYGTSYIPPARLSTPVQPLARPPVVEPAPLPQPLPVPQPVPDVHAPRVSEGTIRFASLRKEVNIANPAQPSPLASSGVQPADRELGSPRLAPKVRPLPSDEEVPWIVK